MMQFHTSFGDKFVNDDLKMVMTNCDFDELTNHLSYGRSEFKPSRGGTFLGITEKELKALNRMLHTIKPQDDIETNVQKKLIYMIELCEK
jgi:hypothetical protein